MIVVLVICFVYFLSDPDCFFVEVSVYLAFFFVLVICSQDLGMCNSSLYS